MQTQNNIPALRFPDFKGEWEEKKINDVCDIIGGGTPDTNNNKYWGGEIQWFTPTEIKTDYVLDSKRTITDLGLQKSSAKKLPIGSILLTTRATIGEVSIALKECTTNQGFQSLIVKNEFNNLFLFNWLKLNKFELTVRANGSTFPEISKSEIQKIKLNIPSLSEQQKIASFLSAVDEKIQQLTRKATLLEQYKKGIMQQLFSGTLRFKDDDGNDFPEWEEVVLKNVFDYKKGNGLSKEKLDVNGINKCILYGELFTKYNEVIFNVISKTNTAEGLLSKKGDLLIPSSTTTSGIDLANVTALNFDDILLGGDITVLRSNQKANSVFYAYYLSNHKKEEIASYAQGITIVHLYYSHIKDMIIDFPDIKEQQKIASFLSGIDDKIVSVNAQLAQTQTFKKGLLQQLFV